MDTFSVVAAFIAIFFSLAYLMFQVQENGIGPVLMVFAMPFLLIWMGARAAYEWVRWNFF